MKKLRFLLCAAILLLSLGIYNKSNAESHDSKVPFFILPLGCTLGQDCWTVNYVDVAPEKGRVKDFHCGEKSYDAHKGTDFALASVARMKAGVDVLAAAEGVVLRVRDGEGDDLKSKEQFEEIEISGRECGNGVLIHHGQGITAIYCHMKKGTISVKPDQRVKAGDKIGQVGQSGMAEFPHLHFGVFSGDDVIDPFTGFKSNEGCGKEGKAMWLEGLPIAYEPVAIFDGGFRAQIPDFKAMERGEENISNINLTAATFVFWVGFYNVEAGDEITLQVLAPDGAEFVERKIVQDKTRARQYYFVGRKIGNVQLTKGEYQGIAKIKRENGKLEKEKEFRLNLE